MLTFVNIGGGVYFLGIAYFTSGYFFFKKSIISV